MNSERARIVFAGTPAFAVPTLERIAADGGRLAGVLTQPDRPAGRGRKLQSSPVKECAQRLDVPVLQPTTLKDPRVKEWLADLRPDMMVIVAYGLILPADILGLPARGCINVHASLLPRWRGASPIQTAILHGDRCSGVSIMQMELGLDTGPVYTRCELEVGENENAAALHDRLAQLGAQCLIEALPGILVGDLQATPQDDALATHAGRIKKADALIDWAGPANQIHNQIRAYNSWPVAHTQLDGTQLRCWASRLPATTNKNATRDEVAPGTVVAITDDALRVQTGAGLLDLIELQLPGRQRVSADEFARGYNAPLRGRQLGNPSGATDK